MGAKDKAPRTVSEVMNSRQTRETASARIQGPHATSHLGEMGATAMPGGGTLHRRVAPKEGRATSLSLHRKLMDTAIVD